jgi:hypothetical protein
MRGCALVPALVVVVLAAPSIGLAQTGAFVGGGGSASSIWFAHEEAHSPMIYNSDTSGSTTDWFITGGGVVAKHAVLQGELTVRSKLKTELPQPQYVPGYPYPPVGTQTTRNTYRFRDVAILGGYTSGTSHRVNVSALAGVMFIQTSRNYYSLYTPPPTSPYPTYPTDETQIFYNVAPVFGLDVPITAGAHLVIVPQVRSFKIPGGGPLAVTAGGGARVQF